MPFKILWTMAATVPSGPAISVSRSIEVNAYDLIKVDVPKNTTNREVQLQPGGAGKVKFLSVVASRYADLKFKVNGTAAGAKTVVLDQPQVLVGGGAVELLDASPKKLFFTNASTAEDAVVEILVGRDAVA